METPVNQLESLFGKIENYIKITVELSKLKLLETTIKVITSLISRISVLFTISIFVLIFNIGMALYLGELLGKLYYGFFIVAAFYLFVGIILHFFLHKWIQKPFSSFIIKQAL
ncbi:MAG: hypothetical protein ACOYO1_02580 [Bacteroidales bacterium]